MPKYEIYVDTDAGECKVKAGEKESMPKRISISRYMDINYETGKGSPKCCITMENEMEEEDGSKTYTCTRASLVDFLQKNLKS